MHRIAGESVPTRDRGGCQAGERMPGPGAGVGAGLGIVLARSSKHRTIMGRLATAGDRLSRNREKYKEKFCREYFSSIKMPL